MDTLIKENKIELRRNGHCNMCGMCCKAIRLNNNYEHMKKAMKEYFKENPNITKEEVKGIAYTSDQAFIYYFWKPISKEEAFEINPHLKDWKNSENGLYYTCTKFDSKTNKCTVHENKPHVCKDYPYYGGNINPNEVFYSKDCGYVIDRKEDE